MPQINRVSSTGRLFPKRGQSLPCLHCFILLVQLIMFYMLLQSQKEGVDGENGDRKWERSPTLYNIRKRKWEQSSIFYNVTHSLFQKSLQPYSVMHTGRREVVSPEYLSVPLTSTQQRILNYFFKEYLKFHASHRNKKTRALVFRPVLSGMGDLFNFLSYAYWCSVISKRLILIDWKYPFPITDFFQNAANSSTDVFYRDDERGLGERESSEIESFLEKLDGLNRLSNISGIFNGFKQALLNDRICKEVELLEGILFSDIPTVVIQTRRSPRSRELIDIVKRHLPKGFVERDANAIVKQLILLDFRRTLLHQVLQLSDVMKLDHGVICKRMCLRCGSDEGDRGIISAVRQKLDQWTWVSRRNENEAKNARYIGVHARLGIGVGEDSHPRFLSLAKNIGKAADCLASRAVNLSMLHESGPVPIFLATDSPNFRPVFRETVHRLSAGRIRVVYGHWNVVHSKHAWWKKALSEQGLEQDDFWAARMDLAMLGHSEHVISMYSTFPRFAVAVGDALSLTELRPERCERQDWSGVESRSRI